MKQIFHPYSVWEGFLNGMYEPCKEGRKERVFIAAGLLANPDELKEAMIRVTKEWVNETEHVLTDATVSHRAWLGQSACNIYADCKEDETREAWGLLTEQQRKAANMVADFVDAQWRERFTKRLVQQSLFEVAS